jgi:CheY-like chemotaxis protein
MPRVMHVDDNPGDREILQLAMDAVGADAVIEPVCSGQEALDRLGNATALPDLVVLDLNLGPLDGLVVLRKLRAQPALAGLPIVVLTSSMRSADRGVCLAAGANGYLTKPATWRGFSDIAADLVRLLRGEPGVASGIGSG